MSTHDLADDSFVNRWPTWLRWILFIPASVVGAVIVPVLYNILAGSTGDDTLTRIWAQIIASIITGFVFVYFAGHVAPKAQFEIAVIFLAALAVILGIIWMRALDFGFYAQTSSEAYYTFHSLLTLGGGIGALFTIKTKLEESKPKRTPDVDHLDLSASHRPLRQTTRGDTFDRLFPD